MSLLLGCDDGLMMKGSPFGSHFDLYPFSWPECYGVAMLAEKSILKALRR